MNFVDKRVKPINWNKILKIVIGAVVGIVIFRMLVFTIFLGEFMKAFTNFNSSFEKGQQAIHNKIEADFEQARRDREVFDQESKRFDKTIQDLNSQFDAGFEKISKGMAAERKQESHFFDSVKNELNNEMKNRSAKNQREIRKAT